MLWSVAVTAIDQQLNRMVRGLVSYGIQISRTVRTVTAQDRIGILWPAPGESPRYAVRMSASRGGVVRGFFQGIGYLIRGIAWTLRNPGALLLGLLPALIVLIV